MLDKKIFLKGIKYLNAYYNNFKFDINDNLKLEIWFGVFSSFADEDFTQLVKDYCTKNIYAPQSPTSLFEHAKNAQFSNSMNSDDAWEYAISLLRGVGYDFSRFYSKCEYSVISQTIKSIQSEFDGIYTNQLPFVKRNFVELYDKNLKMSIEKNILNGQISLGFSNQNVLTYKGDKE